MSILNLKIKKLEFYLNKKKTKMYKRIIITINNKK